MAVQTKRKTARKATDAEVQALEKEYKRLEAGKGLDAGCEDSSTVYADLPDEVKDNLTRVDFSILRRELMEVNILDHDAVMMLSMDQLFSYVEELEKTLRFYVQGYMDLSGELANAQGLILNQQNTIFGRSSQRSSALFGKDGKESDDGKTGEQKEVQEAGGGENTENEPGGTVNMMEKEKHSPGTDVPVTDAASASFPATRPEGGEPGKEGKEKNKPKRSAGCAEKVYEDAEVCHIDCTIPEKKLDELFGSSGWKEVPGAEKRSTEYTIIPAKIIIRIFHLHAYCAAESADPDAKGMIRAKLPITRPRAKSPISSGLLAHIVYERNCKRIPVDRICSCLSSNGLELTPQRVYENLKYYTRYFRVLYDQMWTILLTSHYIQADETPVRYYDRKEKKMKRGYLWVFTTSEMLMDGRPITLFYFAEGRNADVLRHCLEGFTGFLGSDGHAAYQTFARESGGAVVNAGCLDHFRKRVVAALRAVPGLKEMTEEEKLGIPAYVIMLKLNRVFHLDKTTKALGTKEERDAYRNGPVRDSFEDLVRTTLGIDLGDCPAKGYTSDAIRYMKNQEVYLNKFLEDGNVANNNAKAERKFAFFAILRNQVKMFGSPEGVEVAALLESIEQTARDYIKDTRIYYQFLFDEFVPFIKAQEPDTDYQSLADTAEYLPGSKKYEKYREAILEQERELVSYARKL